MGKTSINLIIVLGLIVVAFSGYYLYVQNSDPLLKVGVTEQSLESMLKNTSIFIERRKILDDVDLNIEFFEDKRFTSLHKFTTPIQQRPIGRQEPFTTTGGQVGDFSGL